MAAKGAVNKIVPNPGVEAEEEPDNKENIVATTTSTRKPRTPKASPTKTPAKPRATKKPDLKVVPQLKVPESAEVKAWGDWDRATVRVLCDVRYMKRKEMLAAMDKLGMLSEVPADEKEKLNITEMLDIFHDAVEAKDKELAKSKAERYPGDIDVAFGLGPVFPPRHKLLGGK